MKLPAPAPGEAAPRRLNLKSTPMPILSTESSHQMKQAGRSAGAAGWRLKPFDPARPIEVIGKVVR